MKKRWICLYVENEIGVLARISGLFSAKSYNLDSLTVGVTEDKTVSRMTIGLTSDDRTFEQIKKQLNRSVEVIRVVDYTDIPICIKEILFIKIWDCQEEEKQEILCIAKTCSARITEEYGGTVLLECVQPEEDNDCMITQMQSIFGNRMEIVRGGSVAIESCQQGFFNITNL